MINGAHAKRITALDRVVIAEESEHPMRRQWFSRRQAAQLRAIDLTNSIGSSSKVGHSQSGGAGGVPTKRDATAGISARRCGHRPMAGSAKFMRRSREAGTLRRKRSAISSRVNGAGGG
jgi:hypothetical protein